MMEFFFAFLLQYSQAAATKTTDVWNNAKLFRGVMRTR
jgi:hypothetical protein